MHPTNRQPGVHTLEHHNFIFVSTPEQHAALREASLHETSRLRFPRDGETHVESAYTKQGKEAKEFLPNLTCLMTDFFRVSSTEGGRGQGLATAKRKKVLEKMRFSRRRPSVKRVRHVDKHISRTGITELLALRSRSTCKRPKGHVSPRTKTKMELTPTQRRRRREDQVYSQCTPSRVRMCSCARRMFDHPLRERPERRLQSQPSTGGQYVYVHLE